MTADFQLVIDCADPESLARFWAAALFEEGIDHYGVAMRDAGATSSTSIDGSELAQPVVPGAGTPIGLG